MAGGEKNPPHREKTDESLRVERAKADDEFARRRGIAEHDADDVVRVARQRADTVLQDARDREDERVRAGGGAVSNLVVLDRAHEDAVLAGERRTADDTLAAERKTRQLALAALLASERGETDLRLLLERTTADQLLSSRDDLISVVSHDLRSFLGAIVLNAEMLQRSAETNRDLAATVRYSQSIQNIAAEMTRIVGDLLDAASIDAGKIAIVAAPHDAGQLVRSAVDVFRAPATAAAVSLLAEVGDGNLTAIVDPDRLLQVLSNLVGNALKFTPAGGRVTVKITREGEVIRVAVADTGEGIPADKLGTIFERFSQGRRVDRRGLGLGIAKRIVDAHGGKMWAESTVGNGSTFFFTLPCAPEVAV